ncbi:sensor histidine kinase [Paenibacillus sp. GCM10028914]|uniref:sensor histidine kinase n=1 Tax=Paenibacillus sp. GCM10028914 TaxID=3273416 RepID=UPI0036150E44
MRKNWRMSSTLRLFFILVVILPIILFSIIILNIYERDILQQNTLRSQQTAQALSYSVSQEVNRLTGLFASIGMDKDVLAKLNDIHQKIGIEKQQAEYELKVLIEKYTASISGRVLSVNFFFKDHQSYSYLRNLNMDDSYFRQLSWYKGVLQNPDSVHFLGMMSNSLYGNYNPYNMVAALSPSVINPLSHLEMMLFTFESSAFDHILQPRDNTESTLHIVTEEGQIISSNTLAYRGSELSMHWFANRGQEDKGYFVDMSEENKKLITYAKIDQTQWWLVQSIPYADLTANYQSVNYIVWIFAIMIIVAFILVSFYLVSNVTKPLSELLRQMDRVTEGDLNAKFMASGSLELIKLGYSFNHMTDRVQELLLEHEKQEIEKRKAEFAALQSQINPHFLINTLNSIKFMALISKADNIRNMTHALTRLLASSFNRGGILTTIGEEMDHLKHYIYIMEIRFGRPIQTEWEVDEGLSDYYILKLLLQPILENSIIHGLKNVDYSGIIQITVKRQGEDLVITIADNGVGMMDIETQEVNSNGKRHQHSFSGMGNSNVHNRIQLHYGSDYGLNYQKNIPQGTIVSIKLPLIQTAEENEP